MENPNLPSFLLEHTPWQGEVNPIWPASLFILHRNLLRHHFPPKLMDAQANQVQELVKNALFNASDLKSPQLLKAEAASWLDKEFLFEHFLCLQSFQNTTKGQGFVIDESAKFLALLNVGDHVQLHLLDTTGSWEKTWASLIKIETALGEKFDLAFTPKFGYLTSDPNICGTALLVHVYLHLPALIHTGQLQETLVKQGLEEVTATSLQGGLDEIVGDIVVLKNSYTLGLTEEAILQALQGMALKLVSLEQVARRSLESNTDIKDRISRAYGLLIHSYQLQTRETLDALSLLKLGLDLGWITGTTHSKLNDIFFKCRHAHLSLLFKKKELDPGALAHHRAEFIHKELAGVELKT